MLQDPTKSSALDPGADEFESFSPHACRPCVVGNRQSTNSMRSSPRSPADQRATIAALVGGQLTLSDTNDLLREASAQQGDRRRWILEHWPHIVEIAELDLAHLGEQAR